MQFKSMLQLGASFVAVVAGFAATEVFAQSTGTQTIEEVFVVAKKRNQTIGGVISAVQVPKARSTVTQEYLERNSAGQSIAQSLNLVPGVNFTNNDPYGSSGGNIRIRGYDGNRIALLEDGMPLNDTGNYAIFTNQQLDEEIIDHTDVNLGTTDVDAPTAAAVGGTVNIITRKPLDRFHIAGAYAGGSFRYNRGFVGLDTGLIGQSGISAFGTGSYQHYDKFRGPGDLEKKQINARIFKSFNGGDFISVAAHFNRNRNNFYRNLTRQAIGFYGWEYDNLSKCTRGALAGGAGAQSDNSVNGLSAAAALAAAQGRGFLTTNDDPTFAASCTNYYNLRVNPSDTGNVRIQSKFTLTDKLTLTVDPSFQFVLANGGGTTVVNENDSRLRVSAATPGIDLNHDGDVADSVRLYTPNNTNTRRWGLNTSIIYQFVKNQTLRFAYSLDYGLHRQTGQASEIAANGDPADIFGGVNAPVLASDGSVLRSRDRRSVALLHQFAVDYDARFWEDRVHLNIGLRAPFFRRNLNQYCYTQFNGAGRGTLLCTDEAATAVAGQPNLVTLALQGANQYVKPFQATKHFQKLLPNAGISVKPFNDEHMFFINYAQGLAAPRTDNLYNIGTGDSAVDNLVQPEKSEEYDIGYRIQTRKLLATFDIWRSDFNNFIVTSFDQNSGVNIDRNVGKVRFYGADVEFGTELFKNFNVNGSASYNHTTVKQDYVTFANGAQVTINSKGARLVETPTWTFGGRAMYSIAGFDIGLQGKYVTQRYGTDNNDEKTPAYAVFDGDVRYSLKQFGIDGTYLQLNVTNFLDKHYLGSISSASRTTVGAGGVVSGAQYAIGAPRTFQVSVHAAF